MRRSKSTLNWPSRQLDLTMSRERILKGRRGLPGAKKRIGKGETGTDAEKGD